MKKNKWCLSFLAFIFVSASAWSAVLPPLFLIDFTVTQSVNKVDIKWKTSIETGGPYFTIEKSKDGKEYTKIVDLPETEDGTVYSDYFETDYQPYQGVSYYRIKQTDAVGNYRYSQTVVLKIEDDKNRQVSNVDLSLDETLIVLRDSNGNDFYSKAIITAENNKLYTSSSFIPAGEYVIVASSNEEIHSNILTVK